MFGISMLSVLLISQYTHWCWYFCNEIVIWTMLPGNRVRKGSVLGPILFSLYTHIHLHGFFFCYGNDVQLFLSFLSELCGGTFWSDLDHMKASRLWGDILWIWQKVFWIRIVDYTFNKKIKYQNKTDKIKIKIHSVKSLRNVNVIINNKPKYF